MFPSSDPNLRGENSHYGMGHVDPAKRNEDWMEDTASHLDPDGTTRKRRGDDRHEEMRNLMRMMGSNQPGSQYGLTQSTAFEQKVLQKNSQNREGSK